MRPACVELVCACVYPAHPIEFTLSRLDCPALIQFRLTKRDFCLPHCPALPSHRPSCMGAWQLSAHYQKTHFNFPHGKCCSPNQFMISAQSGKKPELKTTTTITATANWKAKKSGRNGGNETKQNKPK